jgi:hypothetical protein
VLIMEEVSGSTGVLDNHCSVGLNQILPQLYFLAEKKLAEYMGESSGGSNEQHPPTVDICISDLSRFVLQVKHRPVLPKSASWEPEAVRRKLKQVNAMIA